ncbi:MAG: U32 family peptidase [Lachnospiraceae bacterium]|nr:U32 family peptidase [Lachnospiraceae bacterium]
MKSRVELLAPAGNYEAFLGAVNAGADAVYLGGEKFGARAYADNFTDEDICRALHTAHFMGKKVYLTVNTLIKETEFAGLYDWLLPFYEAGLDGVIVQDIGVLCYIREHFKDLALHASTQMTLTGTGGASFMKEQGVTRIVPARELSLAEVRHIKEETGLELECFIHGAMCYCYSGQCLFSSILGRRSGNRGRCAQPCRLPYRIYDGKEAIDGVDYPLSLKDMCTIDHIPQLIEAGIDSFKIEGRMKKPEYTAGVTALYRKYINLYEEQGAKDFRVTDEDMENLRSLYIRSEVQTGYYERHNGREMITLQKPSYTGSDQNLLEQIRTRYIKDVDKLPVKMSVTLTAGEASDLQITDMQGISVSVSGNTVEAAQKSPLSHETVRKQMEKTGNSHVRVTECEIDIQGDVFLPIGALNELRRKGVEAFERQYIIARGMISERRREKDNIKNRRLTESVKTIKKHSKSYAAGIDSDNVKPTVDILVSTYEQLAAVAAHPCRRIYIDSDLYLANRESIERYIEQNSNPVYCLALPYVLRARDDEYMRLLTAAIKSGRKIRGFLVRNYEEVTYVRGLGGDYIIVPDAGLYVFNRESIRFWEQYSEEYTLPYELNAGENMGLVDYGHHIGMNSAMVVYSRIPMMITANCVKKTGGRCTKQLTEPNIQADDCIDGIGSLKNRIRLKDRYGTDFPVETNCVHCYNIIYNSVPYSLHTRKEETARICADIWRYDFTVESETDCMEILEGRFPYKEYTTGHFKRGVE